MILSLAKETTVISDESSEDPLEQPIFIEYFSGSDSVAINGYNGDFVHVPCRMIPELIKVLKGYKKQNDSK